eukprot:5036006-Prymnesium_polylepis.1
MRVERATPRTRCSDGQCARKECQCAPHACACECEMRGRWAVGRGRRARRRRQSEWAAFNPQPNGHTAAVHMQSAPGPCALGGVPRRQPVLC